MIVSPRQELSYEEYALCGMRVCENLPLQDVGVGSTLRFFFN